jgi:hypothetical protein
MFQGPISDAGKFARQDVSGDGLFEKLAVENHMLSPCNSGQVFDPTVDNSDDSAPDVLVQQQKVYKRCSKVRRKKRERIAAIPERPPSPPKPDFFQIMANSHTKWIEESGHKDIKAAYMACLYDMVPESEKEEDMKDLPATPNIPVRCVICSMEHKP